jgi:hypothetical protein
VISHIYGTDHVHGNIGSGADTSIEDASRRDPHMLVFDYCFLRILLPIVLLLMIRVATINQAETSLLDLGNVILPCYLLFLYALQPEFFKRLSHSSPTRQHRVWTLMLLYNLAFITIDKVYDLPLRYYVGDGYESVRDALHDYFGFGNFRPRRSAILILLIFGHLLSSSSYIQERMRICNEIVPFSPPLTLTSPLDEPASCSRKRLTTILA